MPSVLEIIIPALVSFIVTRTINKIEFKKKHMFEYKNKVHSIIDLIKDGIDQCQIQIEKDKEWIKTSQATPSKVPPLSKHTYYAIAQLAILVNQEDSFIAYIKGFEKIVLNKYTFLRLKKVINFLNTCQYEKDETWHQSSENCRNRTNEWIAQFQELRKEIGLIVTTNQDISIKEYIDNLEAIYLQYYSEQVNSDADISHAYGNFILKLIHWFNHNSPPIETYDIAMKVRDLNQLYKELVYNINIKRENIEGLISSYENHLRLLVEFQVFFALPYVKECYIDK